MTEERRTYKKERRPSKKLVRITFRVTEEEHILIRKHTLEAGFETESEYLRYLCSFRETARVTDAELQTLKTDILYCRGWIEQHKEVIDSAISAINLALKLFS